MHLFAVLVVSFFAYLYGVEAQTQRIHVIEVGSESSFRPDSVLVSPGDTVSFRFMRGNHSVVQSTFDNPCTKMEGGIDSGWQLSYTNDTRMAERLEIPINDTQPMWFFCAQTNGTDHCREGEVFAVNPSTDQTIDAFKAKARGQNAGVVLRGDIKKSLAIATVLIVSSGF